MYIDIMKRNAPPAYLANGIQQWQDACTQQEKHGFAAVAALNPEKYDHFAKGVVNAMHDWPKNVWALIGSFPTLDERMTPHIARMTERAHSIFVDSGDIVVPEFRVLMTEGAPEDIYRAGMSYHLMDSLNAAVREMTRLDHPYIGRDALAYRATDVVAHDRPYNEQERTLMYDAFAARSKRNDWMSWIWEQTEFDEWSMSARTDWPGEFSAEAQRLESAEKALTDAWWQQVKQYVAKEQK